MAPGRLTHAIGVDFVGVTIEDRDVAGETTIDDPGFVGVPFPGYVLRAGVTRGFDAGIKLSTTGAFAIDGKVQLVRGSVVALALDPGLLAPFRFDYLYLNLPILLSLEVGNAFTVTLSPKSSWVMVLADHTDNAIDGLLVGGGLHVQIRIVPGFAVTPGVEILTLAWGEDRTATVIDFGIGFVFGALPEDQDAPDEGLL